MDEKKNNKKFSEMVMEHRGFLRRRRMMESQGYLGYPQTRGTKAIMDADTAPSIKKGVKEGTKTRRKERSKFGPY